MIASRLLDLFYPRRCPVCGKVLPFGETQCTCHSLQTKRVDAPVCEHCGAGLDRCTCARSGEVTLEHLAAPFYYCGKVRDDLLELKFHGEKALASKLGREMAVCFAVRFANVQPDVVTSVPMTKKSERARGFNQSTLLAKRAASQLLLPFAPLLKKTRETEKQHECSEAVRKTNLLGAFALQKGADVRGKTVLLIDDIKTTGATLHECAQVLTENGAARVYCLCCAVTEYFVDQTSEISKS
ncbi:MAG: ComF family protein [Clostridia bacterium]|nr:ComF family protein [Clostridia bacterium]